LTGFEEIAEMKFQWGTGPESGVDRAVFGNMAPGAAFFSPVLGGAASRRFTRKIPPLRFFLSPSKVMLGSMRPTHTFRLTTKVTPIFTGEPTCSPTRRKTRAIARKEARAAASCIMGGRKLHHFGHVWWQYLGQSLAQFFQAQRLLAAEFKS